MLITGIDPNSWSMSHDLTAEHVSIAVETSQNFVMAKDYSYDTNLPEFEAQAIVTFIAPAQNNYIELCT